MVGGVHRAVRQLMFQFTDLEILPDAESTGVKPRSKRWWKYLLRIVYSLVFYISKAISMSCLYLEGFIETQPDLEAWRPQRG